MNKWKSKLGMVDWTKGDTAYISCVFTWSRGEAFARACWLRELGYKRILAGGPAIKMNPDAMPGFVEIGSAVNALQHHNPDATFTSRGCIRKCSFCIVPKVEGDLIELEDWPIKPIVCDNNLLACSTKHFDSVIDKLKKLNQPIDFNQGLDARLLTSHHAERLAELKLHAVRLAWDHIKTEQEFRDAFSRLQTAGIPAKKIQVYVLLGYKDTPEDALYRLEEIRKLGALPNPMRYQPLNAKRKNEYIEDGWNEELLANVMRYYSNLNWLGHIDFADYKR